MSLPPSHEYYGSFLRSTGLATSASGGVVIAVHRSIVGVAPEVRVHSHIRARAITVSLHLHGWVHLANVHMDPALACTQKRRLLLEMSQIFVRQSGNSYMMGDWNLALPDETRMSGLGVDGGVAENMGDVFDDHVRDYIELVQRDCTFRRLAREVGVHSIFSRIV